MVLKIVYPVDVKTEEERAAYRKEFLACGRKRYILTKSAMMKTPEGRAEWARFEREKRKADEELLQAGLI